MVRISSLSSSKLWTFYVLGAHLLQMAAVDAASVQHRARTDALQAHLSDTQQVLAPAPYYEKRDYEEDDLEAENYDEDDEEYVAEEYQEEEEEDGDLEASSASFSVDVPVKGPVAEEDQSYDKEGRQLVYEVDVDQVKNMIDLYLAMGKEKFAGFLATCSNGHFMEAMKMLSADMASNKEGGNLGRLNKFLDATEEYLKHNTAAEMFRNAFKGGKDVETFKQLEKLDQYCVENEEECNEELTFQQQSVENSTLSIEYKRQARRRSKLIQQVLQDIEDGKDVPISAAEFEYREGNIFLDENSNEYYELNEDDCQSGASHLRSSFSTLIAIFMVTLLI
ncbi:hypothetical protein KL918_003727 [Ogataea parapolymorpha]|uniref:Secreted protein n=1 Tax=Ogataea parapolymorpha (strain ATCC 26012 / BCRC 20466 / JCM 22074 / NRRL Y-7560 / DL-1) TaxID=871575 RepID=W1QJZ3_OGAPD|nr:hypothetical protein HPODL_04938 [Ogataea parapolymorpha DL-1]ESX02183.1 hypothetical protein HPODL_04938 [Ogataea parapolymorpha DL-1]KAG7866262.1 hypothetical protein KL918_003727 [Ogataea parapolymorpha]KAG7872890.1 hypothetical protein KL916_002620 [Ogataea parapolymorpha]